MISLALTILIKTAMRNHIYSFAQEIRKQSKGGAIGNTLTGALACIWMLYWARIFKKKIKSATINIPDFQFYFLKYYVDDGNMASESLPAGARLINDKVEIIESLIESDLHLPNYVRTADIILQIANSVSE